MKFLFKIILEQQRNILKLIVYIDSKMIKDLLNKNVIFFIFYHENVQLSFFKITTIITFFKYIKVEYFGALLFFNDLDIS